MKSGTRARVNQSNLCPNKFVALKDLRRILWFSII